MTMQKEVPQTSPESRQKAEDNRPMIIYHHPCSDGFCAAWLFSKAFPDAYFQPCAYGEHPPVIHPGQQVFIVDVSFDRETMKSIYEVTDGNLVVLDHHKTAERGCKGLHFCTFDMNKSGARLAWEYLYDHSKFPFAKWHNALQMVNYVEDRDLWKFDLEASHEINYAMRSYPFEFEEWDFLHRAFDDLESLKMVGMGIKKYRETLIRFHTEKAKLIEFEGHEVYCVNCSAKDIQSEVGAALAVGRAFSLIWYDDEKLGFRVWSLRSTRESDFDVSAIAKKFGGGGHHLAAGFQTPIV